MVLRGCLSPDPSNRPEEQILPSDVSVIASSSDSEEEEEISHEGYDVLPQDIGEINDSEINDSESEEGSCDEGNDADINLISIREPPSFDESTKFELTKLWDSSGNNRRMDIIIDSAKEEQIKKAMAGFQLPSRAIPSWAAHVPEEEWKEQLKNRIALLNKVSAV